MEKVILASPNSTDLFSGNVFEVKKFPDSENYIRLTADVKGKETVIVHRCWPDQDGELMRLFFMADAVKRGGAARISAVVPYVPYARQDKLWLSGEAMSAEVVCGLIRHAGIEELITFDCHFLKKKGTFEYGGLKIVNRSMNDKLLAEAKKRAGKDALVISPDMGAKYLVEDYGGKSMKKVRGEYKKGETTEAYREIESMKADFEVSGKNVIIIDDMIAGGGTMIKAVEKCLQGGAKKVFCATTHGLLLNSALERLKKAGAEDVICTNTIKTPVSYVDVKEELKF
ncbi:Ribose-phosphate pyrophosphokinase [Candidatus Gugararchaeum adminiculabundum]|nr:Ribose-phosphate pyrophosphokinase [Candidatus Gugararchaeum adminiculabundum]